MYATENRLFAQDNGQKRAPEEDPLKAENEPAGGAEPQGDDSPPEGPHQEGETPGAGIYKCVNCPRQVEIGATEPLPSCPGCGDLIDPSYYQHVP